MSSTYLTSTDMTMIERLLAEVREPGPERSFDRETAAARFLIQHFTPNADAENQLRKKLAVHINTLDTVANAIARWDDDGGAIRRGATS